MEKKRTAAIFIAIAVTAAGIAVMAGWIFDIPALKSLFPAFVSMKFSTAFAFALSGISLYFIATARKDEFGCAQIVLFTSSLIIMLLMGTLLFSALLKMHTGIEDMFVKDAAGAVMTPVPGRPSTPTMLNFILMALAGVLTLVNIQRLRIALRTIGLVMGLIGAVAIVGYSIGAPLLYYYIQEVNSAIALNTAGLFVVLGTGLLCL